MDKNQDVLTLKKLADIFDRFGIAYAISGSMASSIYGSVRFTQDADVLIEPFHAVAEQFYEIVKSDFYISAQAMHEALNSRGSFNIICLETAFKIDIFVQPDTQFQSQLLQRSRTLKLSDSVDKFFNCLSPEDIILLKLDWYRRSDCVSERQWSDVLGVLAVQTEKLDLEYLRSWAEKLILTDLVERAILESKQ